MPKIGHQDKLAALVAQITAGTIKAPDEFTAQEFCEQIAQAGGTMTLSAARQKLGRMADNGELERRLGVQGGRVVTFFRFSE